MQRNFESGLRRNEFLKIRTKPNLDIVSGEFKTQYIDKHQNTLCEKSQSVFFLPFPLAKVGFRV